MSSRAGVELSDGLSVEESLVMEILAVGLPGPVDEDSLDKVYTFLLKAFGTAENALTIMRGGWNVIR